MMITVLGLGPGRAGLITREAWQIMQTAKRLILRTKIHPTVDALEQEGIGFTTFDHYYQEAENFEELYACIVEALILEAKAGDVVYAVPGSPVVAERTVAILRERAREEQVALRILPGMSFLEILYHSLEIDPIDGIAILDAEDLPEELPKCSLILTQVYDRFIASDLKLRLMEYYPDDYEIVLVHRLSLPEEIVRKIPLYELDRQKELDYLTTVYLPMK